MEKVAVTRTSVLDQGPEACRRHIVQQANLFRLRQHRRRQARTWRALPPPVLLGMRHIQQAVCIARRNRLVSPSVLDMAGFNYIERSK